MGLIGLALGCGGGDRGPPTDEATTDWDLISGEIFACPDPCTSNGAGHNMALDFTFDGDDLLATGFMAGTRRLSLATMTWSEPLTFDVGSTREHAAALDDGQAAGGGMLANDPDKFALTEFDPANGPSVETPLPRFIGDRDKAFALDEQGQIWFDSAPADNVTSTVTILDRATGTKQVVTYATPPADAEGNVNPSFILGSALWGPVPGGGVLAVRQKARGSDLVRLMPDGTATFVVHANGSVGTIARLRIRDGYIYTAGYGLWRSRQKLFQEKR
jgi:hypothetical protein